MIEYIISFARSARKELESLKTPLIPKIFRRIEALGKNPRPVGCLKLRGEQNLSRIRIGNYRVVYTIDDKNAAIDIISVRHRSDAYR